MGFFFCFVLFFLRGLRPDSTHCNQVFYLTGPISKECPASPLVWLLFEPRVSPAKEDVFAFCTCRGGHQSLGHCRSNHEGGRSVSHHLQTRICLRLCRQPSKDPPQCHTFVRGECPATESKAQSQPYLSPESLAALQPFLLLGDNVAKTEGLALGRRKNERAAGSACAQSAAVGK